MFYNKCAQLNIDKTVEFCQLAGSLYNLLTFNENIYDFINRLHLNYFSIVQTLKLLVL